MSKNEVAKKSNEMSAKGASVLVSEVSSGLQLVQKGYLSVTPQVAKLYDCKGYKVLGYKNFDEMCMLEWGMSHGTSVGIRKVFALVGTVSANNEYKIPEKYLEYGYTKLLKIAENKTDFEKANIKPFEVFTPDMTIKQMIDTLKARLEDKAEKQDTEAIDTTESAEATESAEVTNTTESAEATEATPITKINAIMSELLEIRKAVKLPAEKDVYFDSVLANLKEIKKSIK